MNRVLSIVLSLCFVVGLVACSGGGAPAADDIEVVVMNKSEGSAEETVESETSVASADLTLDDYVGSYTDGYNWVGIYTAYGNRYFMDISLTRLTAFNRCSVDLVDGKIRAAFVDAEGDKFVFDFSREGEDFSLHVAESNWELLESGKSFPEMKKIVPNRSGESGELLMEMIADTEKEISKFEEAEFAYSYVDGILYQIVWSEGVLSIGSYYVTDKNDVTYCIAFGAGDLEYEDYKTMQQALDAYGYEYPIYSSTEIRDVLLGGE